MGSNTLTISEYRKIFIDSINSENGSITDYLYSRYMFYKNLNPEFPKYIKQQLDNTCKMVKVEFEKESIDLSKPETKDIKFIFNLNNFSFWDDDPKNYSNINGHCITSLNSLNDGYAKFIELIGDNNDKINEKNKLKWGGTKIQINYLLHKLKKMTLLTNTYESLAHFLIENVEQYEGNNKQTIMDDLRNGNFPKRGVNLDEVLKEVKEIK